MTEIELLCQLKDNLVAFLDELIETLPTEPDFVVFRIFVKDQIPMEEVMKYITTNLCPLGEMVKARNEQFFLQNNVLFEKFDEAKADTVNHMKRLWLSGTLDEENKEVLWDWFQSFIRLGNKYLDVVGARGELKKGKC